MSGDSSPMSAFAAGSKGTPFGPMGGANNNPASYSGGAGKGGGNGGITPQSPNPYMPQGLGRFQSGYQVPRVANAFTNYQPQVMTGGLFSGIPQYNPNPVPIMMAPPGYWNSGAAGDSPNGSIGGVGGTGDSTAGSVGNPDSPGPDGGNAY